jgi:hypothetical protein
MPASSADKPLLLFDPALGLYLFFYLLQYTQI